MKVVGIIMVGIWATALSGQCVLAQDIRWMATVDQNKVSLGETVELTFTADGAQDVPEIQLPSIEGLNMQYLGPRTQISIVNGQYSSSKSFVYSIFPLRTGHFTIPPVSITISGQTHTTQSLTFDVVAKNNTGQAAPQEGPSTGVGNESLEDRAFLVLKVSKDKVYVNERLPIKLLLLVTNLTIADIQFPVLDKIGVDIEKFSQPRQYNEVMNGLQYHVVEFDGVIYPMRSGEVVLGPATLDCNIAIKSTTAYSPFGGSLFSDDFFNSFLEQYEKRPITLQSKPVTLTVLPLPEDGKPADFTQAVGQFAFNVAVAPTEVNVGDPMTIKMNIQGEGNLKAVTLPAYKNLDQFKTYEPQIKEEDGIKKLEQVLIPESEKVKEIAAIQFSFFNPSRGQYETIIRGPFPVTVHASTEQDVQVAGPSVVVIPERSVPLGEDIVFIKAKSGQFYPRGKPLYQTMGFYFLILVLGAGWLIGYGVFRRVHKLSTDVVYARRLLAPRQARLGLREAKRLLESQDRRKFYDALFRTLQTYLGHTLHLSSGAVNNEVVRLRLSDQVPEQVIKDIYKIFAECDAVRYGSSDCDVMAMNESYVRVQRTIDSLERRIK